MLEKKVTGKDDGTANKYKPSAPVSTGTIPRRCSKPPPTEFEGLYEFEAPAPSAPPLEQMEEVAGYETTTFSEVAIPPPLPTSDSFWDEESNNRSSSDGGEICRVTEKTARDALISYARKHLCYGTKAARDMAMTSFTYSSAYHYELQTFTEKRETSWKFIPYKGAAIDDSENGPAPLPWDIDATPKKLFVTEEKVIKVPHTQSVKQCHVCKGTGHTPCNDCSGKGWSHCTMCYRQGVENISVSEQRCLACAFSTHGRGRQDCMYCCSKGKTTCSTCDGYCNLLYYIALTVTWKVITGEQIFEESMLPEDIVRLVSGQVQYEEEGFRVLPIQEGPSEAIRMVSAHFIREHLLNHRNQQILAQRQQIRVVPITKVTYNWNGKEGEFHICGFENKVYAPDYPQTCCCECILF